MGPGKQEETSINILIDVQYIIEPRTISRLLNILEKPIVEKKKVLTLTVIPKTMAKKEEAAQQDGKLEVKKAENFAEWYLEIVQKTGLCDNRYPIKGMNVWSPYGWKIMSLIDGCIRAEMERTAHNEVCFPLLIPKTEFAKEAQHIKGFDAEVYWVTHAGTNKLDIPLLLRPTSETAMYPMLKLWIRSHADLPLRTFQIVNTFRYETKQTRPFIRIREIHFFEAHTCHKDFEDAERQIKEDLAIMEVVGKHICVPYLVDKRPEWDKFPGAFYSLGADCLMPNGRALQIGTIHEYKENFSKPYEITYEAEDGAHKHVHQTTYGMSERLLGAVIGIHGDDKGLILPPNIAPIQVVVVPIFDKDSKEKVLGAAMKIADELRALKLRVHLDDRDMRPGAKFYHWEFLGVPLRIELGPKDMAKGVVTIFRRDLGKKDARPDKDVVKDVTATLAQMNTDMFATAQEILDHNVHEVNVPKDGAAHVGIVRMAWCGDEKCAKAMEEGSGKGVLGTSVLHEGKKGPCSVCGKETTSWVHLANTY